MDKIFLSVLNMSLTASYVILFLMLIRLPLKKAPKAISYALWAIAGLRLVFPCSFESLFSLIPFRAQPIPRTVALGENVPLVSALGAAVESIGDAANGGLGTVTVHLGNTVNGHAITTEAYHSQAWLHFGSYLWLIGMAAMLLYCVVSITLLRRRLRGAVLSEGNIYEAENLRTPFVLGVIRPRIYLPVDLDAEERRCILRHEQTHIRRRDHLVKLLSFFVLSIHWFNPLVWVAFMLLSMDMELSCDEQVIREMGGEIRQPYATSLLSFAAERRVISGSPLAFGEGNVQDRIRNVLNYRQPKLWIVVVAIVAVTAIGVGLLANPLQSMPLLAQGYQLDGIAFVTLNSHPGDQTSSTIIATKGGDDGWEQLTSFLELMKVERQPVNHSRAESRDKTYQIVTYRQKWAGEELYPLVINFSGDFREVWIDDNLKPGYSHRLRDPAAVEAYLPAFFARLAQKLETLPTDQRLAFSSAETDLLRLGTIAFDTFLASLTSEQTPASERIASYALTKISVLAGDSNEFCVALSYDFTTDNDDYLNPARGAKGKGTWPDNYLEIRVRHIGGGRYAIIGIGTGGGGQGLAPHPSQQTKLIPTPAQWSPEQSIGADMAELDYASDDRVIFHGYFGLFVYDLRSRQIIRSLNLKPLNCTATQGDNYCDVTVSTDGNTVQLHRMSSQTMYVYTIADNTLREATYERMSDRFGLLSQSPHAHSGFVPIEQVIDTTQLGAYSYNAVRFASGEHGYLRTSDWTLRTLTYVRGDMMVRLFE